jgi:hypothetical protein
MKYIVLAMISFLIAFISIQYYFDEKYGKELCNTFYKMKLNHTIQEKKILTKNHSERIIICQNNITGLLKEIYPSDIKPANKLFDYIKNGDVLIKDSNSFEIKIFKNNLVVDTFLFNCD